MTKGRNIFNIGAGDDITIRELSEMVKEIVGFKGKIKWDKTKPDGTPKKTIGHFQSAESRLET